MIIMDMPHEEQPEMFSAISISLRFKQVLQFAPNSTNIASNYAPLSVLNSNTSIFGLQSVTSVGFQLLAAVGSAASYVQLAQRV
jgi:hypothetical protein